MMTLRAIDDPRGDAATAPDMWLNLLEGCDITSDAALHRNVKARLVWVLITFGGGAMLSMRQTLHECMDELEEDAGG